MAPNWRGGATSSRVAQVLSERSRRNPNHRREMSRVKVSARLKVPRWDLRGSSA
jgi:hypothetical protein